MSEFIRFGPSVEYVTRDDGVVVPIRFIVVEREVDGEIRCFQMSIPLSCSDEHMDAMWKICETQWERRHLD